MRSKTVTKKETSEEVKKEIKTQISTLKTDLTSLITREFQSHDLTHALVTNLQKTFNIP
jgi:hypothetical protein